MKCIFLADGQGERMKPYSDIMEKCMLPLGGKPVIRITVEMLVASKVVEPEDRFRVEDYAANYINLMQTKYSV